MAHINDVPDGVTQAGLDFDYVNPPEFVSVTLVSVPLDPDHLNVVRTAAAMDTYIDAQLAGTGDPTVPGGLAWTMTLNVQDPAHDLQVEIAYQDALNYYNYGCLTIGTRKWYVFYSPQALNKNVTKFVADIDEWLSYDWTLGYSMVERGHIAVAAALDDTYGADYLTAPEPIDAPPVRGVLEADLYGSHPDEWTVLVISANDLRGSESGAQPFWDLHLYNENIRDAATLASQATINSSAEVQVQIDEGQYPWMISSPPGPPPGEPVNGFVPSGYLTTLPGSTAEAELNTAAAFVNVQASYPSAIITPPISGAPADPAGYWSRALDIAIHADPALYGVTDPDLSPIGESKHGLGIRINVEGVSAADMAEFGFSEFNSYTYTYEGPYAWDEVIPNLSQIFVPEVAPAPVSTIDGMAAGGGAFLFTQEGFAQYVSIMQGAPWILAGIVAIRLVPTWAVSGGNAVTYTGPTPTTDVTDGMWAEAAAIPVFLEEVVSATASPTVLAGWRDTVLAALGATGWTKLVTAQFTDLMVGNGESLASFRPDQWQTDGIGFEAVTGAAHGDPSIRLIPTGYNDLGPQRGIDAPVGGTPGTAHTGFGVAASTPASQDIGPYLAANSTYANWQTMLRNRELSQSLGLENIAMNLGVQGVQAALGGLTGAASGALGGGPIGAAIGAAGAAGGLAGLVTSAISSSNSITLLAIDKDGSFDIGAYGLSVSGAAQVLAFNTWWQGLSSNPGGGTPSNLASAWRAIIAQAFQVIISVPTAERVKKLLSEWRRYGYMIGQAFVPPQLNAMTAFTYWETSGAIVLGGVPQNRRQTIQAAFDRGVTIWENVADIGTEPDNTPLSGLTY